MRDLGSVYFIVKVDYSAFENEGQILMME